jgi:hypothetical protein
VNPSTPQSEAHNERPAVRDDFCGPAQGLFDLFGAFRLVYRNGRSTGTCRENRYWMALTPFALLPEAVTFVARQGGTVVSTATVFADTPLGLPADETFADRTWRRRSRGRRVAELGLVADRRAVRLGRLGYLVRLVGMARDYARRICQARDLVTVVPPCQVYAFAQRFGFASEAEPRPNPALAEHLSVFMRQELEPNASNASAASPTNRARNMRTAPVSVEMLGSRYVLTPSDVRFFLQTCSAGSGPRAQVVRYLSRSCGHQPVMRPEPASPSGRRSSLVRKV